MNAMISLLAVAALASGTPGQAESLRCNGASAAEGDSRVSVLYKCGKPLLADSFCAPVAVAGTLYPGPTVIAGAYVPCQMVEEWVYDRGPGHLVATVRLRSGVVQSIRYGRRPQ